MPTPRAVAPRRPTGLFVALAAVAMPCAASATNGYFAHGHGAVSKGLAGGGIALPQDAMILPLNPAGLSRVEPRTTLGFAIFMPRREYTVTGAPSGAEGTFGLAQGNVESSEEVFVIPHVAHRWALGDEGSLGLSVHGNGGMNTTYEAADTPGGAGSFGAGTAGVDYSQLFVNVAYAHDVGSKASVGVSAVAAYQRFEAYGLASFAPLSVDPRRLSDNGHDDGWGLGAKVGVHVDATRRVSFAAAYQTKIAMDAFDQYEGLWTRGGNADIPATATVGVAFRPTDRTAVTLDVQHLWYEGVAMLREPFRRVFDCDPGSGDAECIGGEAGPGTGWSDVTAVKLGVQWTPGERWTWRAGWSHAEQPIPGGDDPSKSQVLFGVVFPAVTESHLSFGFTRESPSGRAFSLSFTWAPSSSVTGTNALEVPGVQDIELEMDQFDVAFGWTF